MRQCFAVGDRVGWLSAGDIGSALQAAAAFVVVWVGVCCVRCRRRAGDGQPTGAVSR